MSTFFYDLICVVHDTTEYTKTTARIAKKKSIVKQMKLREISVMNSIGDECTASKAKYESCFNTWFSEKFLRGEVCWFRHSEFTNCSDLILFFFQTDDSKCKALFASYQACLKASVVKFSSHDRCLIINCFYNISECAVTAQSFESERPESESH